MKKKRIFDQDFNRMNLPGGGGRVAQCYRAGEPCGTGVVFNGLAREELLVEIDAWGFIDD